MASVANQQQGRRERPAARCADGNARIAGDLARAAKAAQLHHCLVGKAEAVQSAGALSVDDGATTTPLAAADNIAVTDSRTGAILYVNGTSVTLTGIEPVAVPGTHDLFSTLIAAREGRMTAKGALKARVKI